MCEPEEWFVVPEEEVHGGDVLHAAAFRQEGLHVLEEIKYCTLER